MLTNKGWKEIVFLSLNTSSPELRDKKSENQKKKKSKKSYLSDLEDFIFVSNLFPCNTADYHNFIQSHFNMNRETF